MKTGIKFNVVTVGFCLATAATAATRGEILQSMLVPQLAPAAGEQIVLKNDSFVDGGGQAYLQLGFVKEEMAGVWVKVPEAYSNFKIDSFRVLYGSTGKRTTDDNQVFFRMGIMPGPGPAIPTEIENAAQLTPGPFWNDIPAIGESSNLRCAKGGEYIGAALEFTHTGVPSVYRDIDGLAAPTHNILYAVPSSGGGLAGWMYTIQAGIKGDWILRVVGHQATEEECTK